MTLLEKVVETAGVKVEIMVRKDRVMVWNKFSSFVPLNKLPHQRGHKFVYILRHGKHTTWGIEQET